MRPSCRQVWGHGQVKLRMKTNNLTHNSKISIQLIDLTAQFAKTIKKRGRTVDVVRVKKAIECRLDERRF